MEVSDSELVRAAIGGDDDAFHSLVDRHAKSMFRVAMSLSHNRADAEDLLQDSFIAAHRGLKSFEGRASVKTWLLTILTRHAYKAWNRSRHRRATRSLDFLEGLSKETDTDQGVIESDQATKVERRLDVMQVLEQMTDPHREVLVLRELQGLSYDEIAEVLQVPRGTVESRIFRARADFRERFGTPE